MRKVLFLLLSVFIILSGIIKTCSQPFSIPLSKGEYTVGFKSYWKNDYSRTYYPSSMDSSIAETELSPRPVLVNIWYPAVKSKGLTAMEYQQYLQPADDKIVSLKHLTLYRKYNRGVAVNELFDTEEEKLVGIQKDALTKVFGIKTNAFYRAAAVKKKFPLVIYHQGNRASLDDNILLCEYLASHGYVVINSSYLDEEGKTWGVDGAMGSVRDISFILSNISAWETSVDLQRIGIIGHSAGSQAAHIAMAQGSLAIKAMISLETTQEYFTLSDKRWKKFLTPTLQGAEKVHGDLLFIAKPGAIFQLADSMKNANRYYYTIPGVRHNDFIFQGIVRKYVNVMLDGSDQNKKELTRVTSDYTAICDLILRFVDAKLKKQEDGFSTILQTGNFCNSVNDKCLEQMPAGSTKPLSYDSTINNAPTVRQFRRVISESPDKAIEILHKFRTASEKYSIYDHNYSYAIIDELMESGERQFAKKIYKTYTELLGKSFVDDFKFNCDFFGMFDKEIEKQCREKLQFLEKE